jgi:CRP-like cAMP-binding protein
MKQTLLTSGGQEVIVRVKGPGEALNTLGLPFGKPHSVSSQALEPCIVLCWKAEEFESFTNRFPALQRNIAQMAAVSLRELEERYVELATAEVAPRLARMLIRMYQLTGASSGKTVRIGLSREELAQMTGTSLFTVSRLLAQWDAMGIVDTAREAVLIHNTRGLEEIATAF